MGNEVEIHITSKDDTDLGKLGPKYRTQGEKLGNELGAGVRKGAKNSDPAVVPTSAANPIDEVWRSKIRASLKATAAESLKIPISPESEKFRRDLAGVIEEVDRGLKAKIPVELDDAVHFKQEVQLLAHLASEETKVRIPVEADEKSLKKASDDIEQATEKVAGRTQAKFQAIQFAVAFAGLPAAAMAASVLAGAALALVPVAAAAGAAALIHSNAEVSDSFGQMAGHAKESATRAAGSIKDDLVGAIQKVDTAVQASEPELTALFTASGPPLLTFTDGIIKLTSNALPGLTTAAQHSQEPMEGLESLLSDTGAGASELFTNLTKGSAGIKTGMTETGGTVRDLLGFTGNLLTNLANGSGTVLPQFRSALGQVEDVLLSLTSNGMPALEGATSGFLHTVGGAVGIVQGFAGILGSWTQPAASAAGSLFAVNKIAGLFGTSLGQTGFGLKAFSGSIDESGKKTTPFKTALADAEKNGTSKFKAGLNSVVSSGLNPLGIVLGVGSILLDAYGESQQKAAEYAAAHRDNVRQLTDAVRADNGAMGENTQQANAKALADKNAGSNLATFGQSIKTASEAIKGNSYAYDALKFSADATLATIADGAGITGSNRDALIALGSTSLETGKNFDQLKNEVLATGITYDSSGESAQRLTGAQQAQIEALINGTGAVGEQLRAQREAHDSYIQSEQALTGLNRAQIENRDATMQATQAIYDQQNAQLGYRGAVLSSQEAVATFDKVSKDSKATEDQKAGALLKVEQAFATQEQAAYKAAYANSTAKIESGKLADATNAQNRETVNLANTFQGVLPASVQATISKFNVAQAQAAGLTVEIDKTGAAVYRLPNGKYIRIDSSAAAEATRVANLQNQIAALRDRNVRITVTTFYGTEGRGSSLNGPAVARAKGGLVGYASGGKVQSVPRFDRGGFALDVGPGGLLAGPGDGTSDSIFARVSNGEFVVKAAQTRKHLGLLRAINDGRDGFAGGGMVQAEDGSYVPGSFYGGAPAGPHAMFNDSGFAKLRAAATANGIGSLSPLMQEQLRTYGGWTDSAASSHAPIAPRTMSRVGGAQGPGQITVHIDISGGDRTLMDWLRGRIRVEGGGNVQTALGRG